MTEPYYADAFATIYHGDARDILPGLSGDVVLTDPPYAVGVEYDGYDDTSDELASLVAEVHPLMLAAAPVVALTPGIANLHAWPKPRWVLCWRSTNAAGQTGYWGFNEWQPIMVWGTDPYLSRGMGRRPDVISVAIGLDSEGRTARAAGHPCPKPLPAWTKILLRVCPDETATVIDPFMGAGTTLRAAKDTGRRSIGIEPAPDCGGPLGKAIGPAWWDRLNLMTGEQGAHYLGLILLGLRSDPDRFRAMNPDNGWGDYDSLLGVIQRMWEASCAHPLARWHVSG